MTAFTDRFNKHFQDAFVAHMLRDALFLSTVADDVTPDLFPDETMSRLVRITIDFFRHQQTCPGTLIFQILDRDRDQKVLTTDQHAHVSMLADELFAVTLQNRGYLLNEFENFCKVQKYRAELPKIHDVLQRGNLSEVDEILTELLAYRAGQSKKWGRFYSPQEMHTRTERRQEQDLKRLLTFIPDLDEAISGIGEGNINMVQSRLSSDGKTAFLCHLARSFVFQSANVLIFTIGDMTEEEYEDRLDMCFAGLTRHELAQTSDVVEAQRRLFKFRSRIHVKELPASSTKVSDLQNYVSRLEAKCSFYPDVIIVDYADCLGPENPVLRGNLSATGSEVFQGLKQWMQEARLRCWTAGQSGREAGNVEFAEQTHVAGSIEKVRIVDTIVSIQRDTQEETRIKITKSRHDGARGQVFTIPTDFKRMQFYDSRARRGAE